MVEYNTKTLYLSTFQRLHDLKMESGLCGSNMYVEVLPHEEIKSAGGIIVQADISTHKTDTKENRPNYCVVLQVGQGFVDENGNVETPRFNVGDVILVDTFGLRYFSSFHGIPDFVANRIALTRDINVVDCFGSIEEFDTRAKKLAELYEATKN